MEILEKICYNMNIESKELFIKDYKAYCAIKESDCYKAVKLLKQNRHDIFDRLKNKYDYKVFRYIILMNDKIEDYTDYLIDKGKIIEANCIILKHTLPIYLGFIIEWLIVNELREKKHNVVVNKMNDYIYSVDLLVDGKRYQIKSFTFLYVNDEIKKQYIGKQLYFCFYQIGIDSIQFVSFENNPFLQEQEIINTAFCMDIKGISFDEFINKF